jgi:hypothetical protein
MDYVSLSDSPEDGIDKRLRKHFHDSARQARFAGNTSMLMELDRIPMALLGPSNRVPEGARDQANLQAIEALERLTCPPSGR